MVGAHRPSRFLFVSDKAEADRVEKSLGLACVKQVLHFNKESRFVFFCLIIFSLCIEKSALVLLLWHISVDFLLLVLHFIGLFFQMF